MELKEGRKNIFYLSIASILFCFAYLQFHFTLNGDMSWLMLAASRLMKGGMYSKSFFEPNPPLILFLSMPPVIISQLFSVSITWVAKLYVLSVSLFSFAICYSLIKQLARKNDFLFLYGFSLSLLAIFICLPFGELGQRENFIIILTMPYLLSVMNLLQGDGNTISTNKRIIIGIMSALGFALKPFYLVTFIAVELYLCVRKRSLYSALRMETIVMSAVMALYVFIVLVFFHDYIHVMIPFIARYYYQGYATPFHKLVSSHATIYLLAVLIYGLTRSKGAYSSVFTVLCIALFTFFIAYLMQRIDSYYRILPSLSLLILLLMMISFSFFEEINENIPRNFFSRNNLDLFIICVLFAAVYRIRFLTYLLLIKGYYFVFVGLIFASIMYFVRRHEKMALLKTLIIVGLIILCGYELYYTILRTGFSLHFFFLVFMPTTLFFIFGLPKSANKIACTGLFILLFFLWMPFLFIFVNDYKIQESYNKTRNQFIAFLQQHNVHGSVYYFSTNTMFTFSVVDYLHLNLVSRIPFFWMLPGLLKSEGSGNTLEAKKDKTWLIKIISDDLQKGKPDFIIIDEANLWLNNPSFDFHGYFFTNAVMENDWKNYTWQSTYYLPTGYIAVYAKKGVKYP